MKTIDYSKEVKKLIENRFETPPMAYVHSFGCQQNVSDGEKIKGIMSDLGYGLTESDDNADIIIFNTCAIRENAELKVFGFVGELKHLKTKNPDLIIGICGCMPQQQHIVDKIKKTYHQIDIVFGTFALETLPRLIYEVMAEKKRVYDISQEHMPLEEGIKIIRESKFKASVPIIYGCNNFCTYCIVPYVRGRERSRESEYIINEIKELVSCGYKEIMLLGQNVNSYGKDLNEDINFSKLLSKINVIDGDFLVRFMSSHPKDADYELIDTIIDSEKVANHMHLPVQSGSNNILEAMNRKYTREQYMDIVNYARSKMSDFSFSTDIIIGFPNEKDEDYLDTLKLIEDVKFDNVYSFIYSKRTGTKAALMEDSISDSEKSSRMRKFLSLQREIATEGYKRFIGKTLDVLAEGRVKNKEGYLTGRSNEFIIVEFEAKDEMIGKFVKVQITDSHNWALVGKIKI